jgi:hypothetical protein
MCCCSVCDYPDARITAHVINATHEENRPRTSGPSDQSQRCNINITICSFAGHIHLDAQVRKFDHVAHACAFVLSSARNTVSDF